MGLKIVAISDTHSQMDKIVLPEGDVLIHAGDHSYRGTVKEMSKALKLLAEKGKNFKKIVLIVGNHDWLAEKEPLIMKQLCEDNGLIYLMDSSVVIDGKLFYGSPFQPEFCSWAFNLPRGEKLAAKWAQIPDNTDVLITHGPPRQILDLCPDGFRAGCDDLFKRIMEVRPKYHFFGHIHHSYGILHFDGITFVNASTCNEQYMPINAPIVLELD
jgi:Icc-related predicted phosphoesterase